MRHARRAAQVELDFGPLLEVAGMLYGSSFVAERISGIRSFLERGKEVRAVDHC